MTYSRLYSQWQNWDLNAVLSDPAVCILSPVQLDLGLEVFKGLSVHRLFLAHFTCSVPADFVSITNSYTFGL